MGAVDPKGDEKYWNNGDSFEAVRLQAARPGTETFWFEGMSNEPVLPLLNADTGKFLIIFE